MTTTVLSYSGTGVQGDPMVKAFAKAGFSTRTITRNPGSDASLALQKAGVDVRAGDMADPQSLLAATEGVNIVALLIPFFVHPPHDHKTFMRHVLDAAVQSQVELIVWNTSGPMQSQPTGKPMIDYRQELQEMLAASGIPYITLVPKVYMENLMGPWTAAAVREANELAYPLPDGKRLGWITTRDVAALMVEAAKHPELADAIIHISGPENLTGEEMAARFSVALRRPIQWRTLTPREFGDQIGAVMGPQAGDALAEDYVFMNQHMDSLMAYQDMSSILKKLPARLTLLEDWVRQHAFAFT